ncbi:MAG TPA: acetyl-CoA hydrolase/transferase C-terminal domain-containing protein [Steroidobacteraceae bacterium]|nr:acetyl-CoA hydrolase/transferase C-terminal domain-containing protein [Steroidobacteraceae bacterium]
MPQRFDDVGECVETVLRRVGKRIVLALPLALGKPVPFVNELYRRAARDPSIDLKIITAFSLSRPRGSSDLERRFLDPFVARVFGDYPDLDYVAATKAGTLPANVEVIEFFLETGQYLGSPYAQQHYLSANYTHVARDVLARGVNVIAHLIATRTIDGREQVSLSCNPDVTLDLLPAIEARRRAGHEIVMVGEVNGNLPFMLGDAQVPPETFDFVLEHPRYEFDLFAPPNLALGTADHLIGLYASMLVRDGGTLQLGIGELGDAIVYALQLRHQQNATWRQALDHLGAARRFGELAESIGGTGIFEHGVYGCTEMFVDGFLDLYRSGILKRRVYPHLQVQRLLNAGRMNETLNADVLDELIADGMAPLINAAEFARLQAVGVFDAECVHDGHRIRTPRGGWVPADLSDREARATIAGECIGRRLRGGVLVHGAFFLGPRGFYGALRELPDVERAQFNMTSVGFINQVTGEDIALRIAQRRDARFINTSMMMTLLGGAISDQLEDGRVVSGVGGQFNFVAMAHALPDARSILAVRATRAKDGRVSSNILWSYGHVTIPRHLRDIVITEYGIADLRGKTDAECIAAMLAVTDSRFQGDLLSRAKAAGKLPRDFQIPDAHRNNTPAALERALAGHRRGGLFSEFPFGTDFTSEEIVLARALKSLRGRTSTLPGKLAALAGALVSGRPDDDTRSYLARMNMLDERGVKQRLLRRMLASAVREALRHRPDNGA